ncbi:MAG: methyltransferase domain-containing protein [Gammaproteobacteria bacterium]|nr:methyltransferase domain-containing protein [Gammaproteobacteria bacterium]
MKKKHFIQSEQELAINLQEWFGRYPGQSFLEQEAACLKDLLPKLFGYYLVQLGMANSLDGVLEECLIGSCLVLAANRGQGETGVAAQVELPRLPIAADSVDAVLMPHSLDFSSDPHQVLREVERILIPEGRVIITGFNPWSLWGGCRLLLQRQGKIPWCARFISLRRLQDWLQLLGFSVEMVRPVMFRPPLQSEAMMNRLLFLEQVGAKYWPFFSAGYVVQAVKRVSPLTPVLPAWRRRAQLLSGKLIEPTTRNYDG